MTGINTDLAASHGRISDTERRIEALHHKLLQHGADSAEGRYARTALDVLERALRLMYHQRGRMENELKREQKQARRQGKRWYAAGSRARGRRASDLLSPRQKARPAADRDWHKRAGA